MSRDQQIITIRMHIHTHTCNCAEDSKHPGDMYSLYQNVKHNQVDVLNEEKSGSGKKVIKPHENRQDDTLTVSH